MSSAAVQQNTPQRYQQPQQGSSSQGRDRYGANTAANFSSSPPTSRRNTTSRHNSGNASVSSAPQQAQYSSPAVSSPAMASSRGQHMPASTPSDQVMPSTVQQYYPEQLVSFSSQPTTLPVRSSHQPQALSSPTSAPQDSRAYSASRSQQQGYGSESEREKASDNEKRRRQPPTSPANREPPPQSGSGRSQRTRNAPQQSRSATAVGQTPIDTSLPRENSAIINHIVVDDPNADIAREKARVAESRPTGDGMTSSDKEDSQRNSTSTRSRQEHLKQATHRKEVRFGDYILGQTLGEGEFGKVKMGWKKDGGVQVAIKLIRKESLAGNSTRLPKIYREIAILRELQHPNIVRLHEFVETERHMGIILEYASGGELFDYILNHRYLKDPAARRLFAQLVSGVGYLHTKGIVHRDLKLENLLLDRNKNIIITDFGFANTFNPRDELGEDLERRIGDKEYVKREGLDQIGKDGHRKGDLMQTSCGSPCYAAPELVVSDGLYTGRKVDVWSTGVILYAMLAGYLPFDDDPANPEGDNINLLYKYIVSTPLTFPEYVTPHARDLLRRILVPDPRRRADLFEVARHSWLSDYSHVVGFIGSSAKSDRDIASSAARQDSESHLGRSASVREPSTRSPDAGTGGVQKPAPAAGDDAGDGRNKQRDAKRRTVQVEYVAPNASHQRGETSSMATQQTVPLSAGSGKTRARAESQGPVEVTPGLGSRGQQIPRKEVAGSQPMPPPTRPGRDQIRATSDSTGLSGHPPVPSSRPGSSHLGGARLPSRGNSYGTPVAAASTPMNAQGRFSQPKSNSGYIISGPMPTDPNNNNESRPQSQQNLQQFQNQQQQAPPRGHKRSSTLGSITDRVLGRTNSRRQSQQMSPAAQEKRDRKYPPVSMKNAIPNNNEDATPRQSTESSRRTSFGFSRKNSEAPSQKSSRRFSFLPSSFSMNSFGGKKDQPNDSASGDGQDDAQRNNRPDSRGMAFGRGASRSPSMGTSNSSIPLYYDADRENQRQARRTGMPPGSESRYEKALPTQPPQQAAQAQQPSSNQYPTAPPAQRKQYRDDGYSRPDGGSSSRQPPNTPSQQSQQQQQDPPERFYTPQTDPHVSQNSQPMDPRSQFPINEGPAYQSNAYDRTAPLSPTESKQAQHIRPQQRKFGDAYEQGHGGSSSGARRVMDFFRRRGKERGQS
ncbi:hypothetical protein MBLNU230_g5486t1 [Neophaeotheca triangularis]